VRAENQAEQMQAPRHDAVTEILKELGPDVEASKWLFPLSLRLMVPGLSAGSMAGPGDNWRWLTGVRWRALAVDSHSLPSRRRINAQRLSSPGSERSPKFI
jgi:hypothetical protein